MQSGRMDRRSKVSVPADHAASQSSMGLDSFPVFHQIVTKVSERPTEAVRNKKN